MTIGKYIAAGLLVLLGAASAEAVTYHYTGNSTNGGLLQTDNWDELPDFSLTTVFTAADTLYFSHLTGRANAAPTFGNALAKVITIGTLHFGAETGTTPINIGWNGTGLVNLASGVVIDAGAGENSVKAALILAGPVTVFTNNSASRFTFGGALTGSGDVELNNGPFRFNGVNTHTGGTLLNTDSSLFLANGAVISGALTVKSGALLTGRGTTLGAATFESGATLSPGTPLDLPTTPVPVASIFFADALNLKSGSVTLIDIANTNNDSVVAGGLLSYGGELRLTLANDFDFDLSNQNYSLFNFSAETGNFDAVTLYGSAGNKLGELARLNDLWTGDVNGLAFSFDQFNGLLDLNLAAIPEPGVPGLLAVGALGVLSLLIGRKRGRG